MFIKTTKYKLARLYELGARQSISIICNKLRSKAFALTWKKKALAHTAHHRAMGSYICSRTLSHTFTISNAAALIRQADTYTLGCYTLLGSEQLTFTHMPWHEDFRLKNQHPNADCTFDATSFYKDIAITTGQGESLRKDIKIPWELSRCQHLPIIGAAYSVTHDDKYVHLFVQQITDWIEKNPYMIGVNWVGPMEVGIRAINWIWAHHYFRTSTKITPAFWSTFTASLYDHMHYLENNWEIYDGKTSNHYLSDLIGYFYLCWFFSGMPAIAQKREWCYQEILHECDKQIFDEGTSYESSTAYHGLVTEIFDHFSLLCQEMDISLPPNFIKKHARMHAFIDACAINNESKITIGDDDSGHILLQKIAYTRTSTPAIHYPEYGLSIVKNSLWHLSLRHHVYQNKQPSGHIHNDALSITLAAHGIPIIIDPGSYTYTPSAHWRNYFRSVRVHNTFFIDGHEPVPFDERLFALPIAQNEFTHQKYGILYATHDLYKQHGATAHRTVKMNDTQILITDWWNLQNGYSTNMNSHWNYTLHPDIQAVCTNGTWIFYHDNKAIVQMESTLIFTIEPSWVSLHYGSKTYSTSLRATAPLENTTKQYTTWTIVTS